MLIENVEALKIWLTKTLSPISDADPASLAKYVLALVKKDKVDRDLKEVCIDQLDVFLQGKTKGFVDTLFEALTTKEYMKHAPDSSTKTQAVDDGKSDVSLPSKGDSRKDSTDSKKAKSEKGREGKREDRRHGSRSPSPRERRRDIDDRKRRHDDRRLSDERRSYRRRSRSYSPRSPRRTRGRSRSPRERGRSRSWSRSRSRSRSGPRSWSKSRSRSRSRERRVYSKQQSDSRGSTPTLDNGKYDATSSIPTVGSAVYSVPRVEGGYPSESHPQGLPAVPAPSRQRCKDYDEKGFCMRGDLCPYDHGLDPVIVEDVSIPPPPYVPGPPVIPSNGPPRMPGPGFVNRPPPPTLGGPLPMPPRPDRFEYNPEAPGMTGPPRQSFWHGPPPPPPQGPQAANNFPPFPPPQNPSVQVRNREHLINITVKDESEENAIVPPGTESTEPGPENTMIDSRTEGKPGRTVIPPKRPYNSGPGQVHRGYLNPYHQNNYRPSAPKKPFDFSRVGGYRKPDTDALSLEVRKIPKEFNNISAINQHFCKFGNLTNIQVNFENDPEAALVTFSTNQEALACYRSTEPLFNNRFVKVFWHKNKDNTQ
ncbi:RNA-binding protein 26-like, partial [Saccostrea cucullata]|uniref:RNA-binding protein 26-like n=1 Tax=Saccostrea cuccullata TaxID=36930 RepID=UPI002ED57B0B